MQIFNYIPNSNNMTFKKKTQTSIPTKCSKLDFTNGIPGMSVASFVVI